MRIRKSFTVLALTAGMAVTTAGPAWAVERENGGRGFAYYLIVMALEVVFGLFATMIAMWFSRRREFRADHGGATLAGRQKMIAALERLSQQHRPSTLPAQVEAFGIAGGIGHGMKKLFLSHPPLEDRIAALRAQQGTLA